MLKDAYGFKLEHPVTIGRYRGELKHAERVWVREVGEGSVGGREFGSEELGYWIGRTLGWFCPARFVFAD